MSRLPLDHDDGGGRFPGLDVLSQAKHWDEHTSAVVNGRLGLLPHIRFFSPAEEGTASMLFDQLLDQRAEPRIPVVQLIDARLSEEQTDGWHYDDMPVDGEAWRASLAGLDEDARESGCEDFATAPWDTAHQILEEIEKLGEEKWHGMRAGRIWGLWTRYACTAFYSHPWAWDEIGFSGPAYPRGYKNLGVDRLEGFEVADSRPAADPTRWDAETGRPKKAAVEPAGNDGQPDPAVKEPQAGPSGKDRKTEPTPQEQGSGPRGEKRQARSSAGVPKTSPTGEGEQ